MKENMIQVKILAGELKKICDKLTRYYNFSYDWFGDEIMNAVMSPEWTFGEIYLKEGEGKVLNLDNIDYIPDDYNIVFTVESWSMKAWQELCRKYKFMHLENNFGTIVFLAPIFLRRSLNELQYYEDVHGEGENIILEREQKKLYEFLLNNFHKYDHENSLKAKIVINYGVNSQIEFENEYNCLYAWLKDTLHNKFTDNGNREYNPLPSEPDRPTNAPKISNFIAYNTFLLLMDVVGSDTKTDAEFSRFIIDFCNICGVQLIGRQNETRGMTDLIKAAKKQYGNEPIPFLLVRDKKKQQS